MITLQIYKAKNGRWSGLMIDEDGEEIGRIAGCKNPDEVEQTAYDLGEKIEHVELKNDV